MNLFDLFFQITDSLHGFVVGDMHCLQFSDHPVSPLLNFKELSLCFCQGLDQDGLFSAELLYSFFFLITYMIRIAIIAYAVLFMRELGNEFSTLSFFLL